MDLIRHCRMISRVNGVSLLKDRSIGFGIVIYGRPLIAKAFLI